MMGVLALIYGDILQFHREALKYFQQPCEFLATLQHLSH